MTTGACLGGDEVVVDSGVRDHVQNGVLLSPADLAASTLHTSNTRVMLQGLTHMVDI